MGARVGALRARHKIMAPATTGNAEFERAFRVHYNTMENLTMFVPLLWIASLSYDAQIAAIIGGIWILSRIVYMVLYMKNPESRPVGAITGALCLAALLVISVMGLMNQA